MSSVRSRDFRDPPDVSEPIDASTLAAIRQRVRQLVEGRTGYRVDDAVQVTDELVSNAYLHGLPPHTVRLTLLAGGQRLRIEVDDAGPAQPVIRPRDHTGGLGLVLVDRLAAGWGVQRHDGYKTVWAEVDLTDPGHRPRVRHLNVVDAGRPPESG